MKRHVIAKVRKKRKPPPEPPPPSLAAQGRALAEEALDRLLDKLEEDPEAVVKGAERAANSLGRLAVAANELREWAKKNPEEARKKLREAAIDGLQQALKARRRRK